MIVTNYELEDGGHIEVRTHKSGGCPKTSAFRYDRRGDAVEGFDMTSQLGYLAGMVRCTRSNMDKSHAEAVSRIKRTVKLGKILSHKIMNESIVPSFTDFVSNVAESVSPSEARRLSGLFSTEVERFIDATQGLLDAAVDDGFDVRTVVEFMSSLSHKAAAKYESVAEGRTPEQAYQKVWAALDDKGDVNSAEWTTAARAECQKKAVRFADFMEWVEAKDFADMRESVDFDPALLEAKVEMGVATVEHNGYSYEVKRVDSTHVSVRIPKLNDKWTPYHIGQLGGALYDCALEVIAKGAGRPGSPFVTSL